VRVKERREGRDYHHGQLILGEPTPPYKVLGASPLNSLNLTVLYSQVLGNERKTNILALRGLEELFPPVFDKYLDTTSEFAYSNNLMGELVAGC
jgi:hypothetical protein